MRKLTVSLLIGADMSELQFSQEFRMGNKIERIEVLLGGKHNLDNLLSSCNNWICESNIDCNFKNSLTDWILLYNQEER